MHSAQAVGSLVIHEQCLRGRLLGDDIALSVVSSSGSTDGWIGRDVAGPGFGTRGDGHPNRRRRMVTDFGGCDPNDNDRGGLQNQSRFRAIDQHGAALYGALSGASFGDERTAHAQLDWLAMSLGVRHVDIDTDPLGDSMYCGTAAAWDAVRSRHVSTFSEEVLRFLFLWGSLEAAARLAGMRRQDRTRPFF